MLSAIAATRLILAFIIGEPISQAELIAAASRVPSGLMLTARRSERLAVDPWTSVPRVRSIASIESFWAFIASALISVEPSIMPGSSASVSNSFGNLDIAHSVGQIED